jgi:nucleoside-diphosphate-sugar epimerase
MKILVTGGAGYVGSTLVAHLLGEGHYVRVLDSLMHGADSLLHVWSHPKFEFVRGDVRDAIAVESAVAGMDAIVHLAAIVGDPACSREPDLAKSTNLDGSIQLLEAAKRNGVRRFVFASTCSNYGRMQDPESYVNESSPLAPVSLYAETKVAVEKMLLDPTKTGSLCATALRFATIYGVSARMRFDLTVNEFTMEMATGKRLVVFGERFWRPYIHVRDAARAVALILASSEETVRNEVFNVGATQENYQKAQLVAMIQPLVPDAVIEFVHKTEDPRDYRVAFDKIGQIGFDITRTVPDGIQEVHQLVVNAPGRDFHAPQFRN